MDNDSFLQHPHVCVICKKPIDMDKLRDFIDQCSRREWKPWNPESDPVIVKDFGNDILAVCNIECYEKYLNVSGY